MSSKFVMVEDEYSRKPELKKEEVEAIKTWMKNQPHLPKISDLQVALFLNSCYFELEPTKKCIENYYTLRTQWPEFFSKRDPFSPETQLALSTITCFEFAETTQNNHMVFLIKLADANPERFQFNEVVKRIDLMITLLGPKKGLQDGHVVILDSMGLQMGHILRLNVFSLKKYLQFMQEAMAIRLKAIHIINVSRWTEKFLALAKPFLNEEVTKMLHVHKDIEGISNHLPIRIFPSDYGGEGDTTLNLHAKSVEAVEENAEFFLQDEQLKSDESKREGNPAKSSIWNLLRQTFSTMLNESFDDRKKIEEFYKLVEKSSRADVEGLKIWIFNQFRLKKISEYFIILCYHSCYYDMEDTKKCIENFLMYKIKYPNFLQYKNPNSDELKRALSLTLQMILPKRTGESYDIAYLKILDTNASNYNFERQITLANMTCCLQLCQRPVGDGLVFIVDFENFSFGHIFRINLLIAKAFISFIQEALPVRLKAIHVINLNYMAEKLVKMLTPFLNQHTKNLLNCHTSMETVYKTIPKDLLHVEIGGNWGTIKQLQAAISENIDENLDFFQEDEETIDILKTVFAKK